MLQSCPRAAVKLSERVHGALVGVRAVTALQEGSGEGRWLQASPLPGPTHASGTRAAVPGWASGCIMSHTGK